MTLYIIGNGFDIAHHIKCKYCNFADFLGDNYPDYYESIMSGYCSSNALWKDFENELPSCATHIEEFGSQMGNGKHAVDNIKIVTENGANDIIDIML